MTDPHGESYYQGNPFKVSDMTIVGVGAVGSWMAVALAKQGVNLTIADHDVVSERNLGTTVFYDWDIGMHKSDILSNLLEEVRVHKTWEVTPKNIKSITYKATDVLLDCTDNADARNMIQEHSPVPCLHVGINDNWGSATWDDHFTKAIQPEQDDACEVPYSLNLILPLVGLTIDMLAVYCRTGVKESFGFDLISGQKTIIKTS